MPASSGRRTWIETSICLTWMLKPLIDYPPDLTTDRDRDIYRRGVVAGQRRHASRLGSITTAAKAASSRANGAKGGRPRKTPPPA